MSRVVYVVDDPGWVQAARGRQLERHLPDLELQQRTPRSFARRWPWLRRRGTPVYFGSWRTMATLNSSLRFSARELANFMVSVTSHYNLGGGLNPATAISANVHHERAFSDAVDALRACRVTTVNSLFLWELLETQVPNLVYAPNGVDVETFTPPAVRSWEPTRIRLGWVGKVKAAKNFDLLRAVATTLEPEGFHFELVTHQKHVGGQSMLGPEQLRDLYRGIDFYLCLSWHEGTPNPALEAAACGTPPIATAVGNMPELVLHGKNGFLIEPTHESVVQRLRALRQLDESGYLAISAAIRAEIVRCWTWERAASRYRPAFERLLSGPDCRQGSGPLSESPLP